MLSLICKKHLILSIMIFYLQSLNIMVYVHNQITSYVFFLKNRKQYVYVSEYFPNFKNVLCGILEESTLVPPLFLMYVNNLQSNFSKSVIYNFADDTNLLFPNKSLETLSLQRIIN